MKESFKIIVVLTLSALLSGAVLAWFNQFTEARVIENRLAELRKSLSEVVPGMTRYDDLVRERNFALYKVWAGDSVAGYAVEAVGNGYQDKIRVLFGVAPDFSRIYALRVLDQKETPGLGARITEPWYLKGWKNRAATLLVLVKGREATKSNEIQAITGATITSRAVVSIVNKGLVRAKKELSNVLGNDSKGEAK